MTATTQLTDLSLYKQQSRWQAEAGANGAGGRKTGRNGADLVLEVPVGTLVLDEEGGLIADLALPGARAVLAHGGVGGRGNVHFKSSRRHAPDYAEPGLKGDELTVTFDCTEENARAMLDSVLETNPGSRTPSLSADSS